jgi:hypothetical protein
MTSAKMAMMRTIISTIPPNVLSVNQLINPSIEKSPLVVM